MSFGFKGKGADIQTFFGLISMDGKIKDIAIDVSKNKLHTSAEIEEAKHAWAYVNAKNFTTNGTGTFVVSIERVNLALKLMDPGKEYEFIVNDHDVEIEKVGDEEDRTTLDLLPLDVHISPETENSSYIVPVKAFKNKRWNFPLIKNDSPLPEKIVIPKVPPNEDDITSHWQQWFGINKEKLNEKLNNGKQIGCEKIEIFIDDETNCGFFIQGEKIQNRSKIEVEGNLVFHYNQKFDLELIQKSIMFVPDDKKVYIAQTNYNDPNGTNPGLWLAMQVEASNKKIMEACYQITPSVPLVQE